jgi:Family of unknown function (DUF6247)
VVDTPDPDTVLQELPDSERETFLKVYRDALAAAGRDLGEWQHLLRLLRAWRARAIAAARPGFAEAEQHALAGTGDGMLLISQWVLTA